MIFVLLLVSLIFACGVFLILRRSLVRVVIGFGLIGNAVNLAIFAVNGWRLGTVPIMKNSETVLSPEAIDPVPQALILTAIVIGFAMQAFLILLVRFFSEQRASFSAKEIEDGSQ